MKAALLTGYGAPPEIWDVPVPEPGPDEVLVRVAGVGVRHSDLTVASGRSRISFDLPIILVTRLPATSPRPVSACPDSAQETGWRSSELGDAGSAATACEGTSKPATSSGGSATDRRAAMRSIEYLVVPAARHLEPIDGIDATVAAALTDAALTPYRAVRRALPPLVPGSVAVAIGIGGVGHFGLQYLKILSVKGSTPAPSGSPADSSIRPSGRLTHRTHPATSTAYFRLRRPSPGTCHAPPVMDGAVGASSLSRSHFSDTERAAHRTGILAPIHGSTVALSREDPVQDCCSDLTANCAFGQVSGYPRTFSIHPDKPRS